MYLFNLVNVIIEMAIILFYCHSIFEAKTTLNKITKLLIVILMTTVSVITGMKRLPNFANMAIGCITCIVFAYFLCKGTLKDKLFISAIYEVAVSIADILATIVITHFGIKYQMSGGDNITYIVGAMLSNFIRLWLLAYVARKLSRKIHNLTISYWIFITICPILSIMCMIIFDIYLMQAQSVNNLLVVVPPLCILYINFMLFKFFETFSEQIRLKVIEELAQSEEENYKILQNNETELRKLRHDMKNHMLMLHEYLEYNDTDTALKHLNNIQMTLNEISATVCTNNPAIDAAINIGARKAHTDNIEYTAQIIGDAEVNIDAADICKFLSNAIDNAIEACSICEKKYVYIELNITKENIKIHIENTTIHKKNRFRLLTSKTDKKNHGYGIQNMNSVVKKYNGIMEHKIIDGVFYLDTILYNI